MFGPVVSIFNALPHFRGKQRVLRAVFRWLPFSHARSFYGVQMVKNADDSTWRACMVGGYGNFISDYISAIDEEFAFLDIGANQGLFGLCAASNPSCKQVIAVEPNPFTFSLLVQNISLTSSVEKFHVLCGAFCNPQNNVVEMSVPKRHSGASSMTMEGSEENYCFRAPAIGGEHIALDRAKTKKINIHAKIDVEGAELIVLEELKRTTTLESISSIIIEVSEKTKHGNTDDITRFFEKNGWKMVAQSGAENHYDAIFENPKPLIPDLAQAEIAESNRG